MQAEIIESVLGGHDTLGLLPTGGGKSLTFQVPALMLPGLTLVVTPLISLMKDQVDNLREHGVKAVYFHAGMTLREQNLAVDRCRLGKAKMAYVSPEKLRSERFISTLRLMDVSLIVVDEAHCISQWGYDFRPSYLKISELRRQFPDAPVLALTASATPEVADDIMCRLNFRDRNLFSKSFLRQNISYAVRITDQMDTMLLKVLTSVAGCGIVYVRSRRRTKEIATFLAAHGISADYYHAGLAPEEKELRQNRWKQGESRIMVATNAFGMGIDKPDVRVVVHIDVPSSVEEYYQESGRAGRDGLPSYAVIITSNHYKAQLTRRINEAFPPKDYIAHVYEMACNFMNIAVGSGYNSINEFNLEQFCEIFHLKPRPTRSALEILTRAGYLEYVDETTSRSRVMMLCTKEELYSLDLDATTDDVLNFLLRNYTGLFADYVFINETHISQRMAVATEAVYQSLLYLGRLHVIHYVPRSTSAYIVLTTARELPKHIIIPKDVYEVMRDRMERRVEAMKDLVYGLDDCRMNKMLRYFGENPSAPCGKCDVCRSRVAKPELSADEAALLEQRVVAFASRRQGATVTEIASATGRRTEDLIPVVRSLADRGEIRLSGMTLYSSQQS